MSTRIIHMQTAAAPNQKAREGRLRRAAARHGLRLLKSPRRDPDAFDFGLYALVDVQHGGAIHAGSAIGTPYALDLDEAARCLREFASETA